MFNYKSVRSVRPGRVSLTVRVSVLLVLAVVVPLLITVLSSEFILRPTLLSQASNDMESDAQTHSQAIDALIEARVQELDILGQYAAIQRFLSGDDAFRAQAYNELTVGDHLDPNYSAWTLFDGRNTMRLSYPLPPKPRGKYIVPPEAVPLLQGANKTYISDVYFDDATRAAFIDIYASITGSHARHLGYVRATLALNDIWTAVNDETNAGPGNYAMILDENGVRIAYTNTDATNTTLPTALFRSVGALPRQFQQHIKDENLYGNDLFPFKELSDPTLDSMRQNVQGPATFQMTPGLQTGAFQVARARSQIIPWTYLVLRPMKTITKAADQQELYLFLIAALVTVLAAVIGLTVGRGITRPILQSVSSLLASSGALKTLADSEQNAATEQQWIVESSQIGLQSVEYYTEAASIAARQLDETGAALLREWDRSDAQRIKRGLQEMNITAKYIEKAVTSQKKSSIGLASAIRVTAQVTEQLLSGATSAAEAASQLDQVVEQLREVAGK